MNQELLKLRILELYESGMDAGEIAKKVHRLKKDVQAIIDLHAKKPNLELGMKGMLQLAREAGLI